MNKQDFFKIVVEEALKDKVEVITSNEVEAGESFSVVSTDGILKYMSLSGEAMSAIYSRVNGGTYNNEMLVGSSEENGEIKFVSEITEEYRNSDHFVTGMEEFEILVDTRDTTKYAVLSGGEEVVNEMGLDVDTQDSECYFNYEDSQIVVMF